MIDFQESCKTSNKSTYINNKTVHWLFFTRLEFEVTQSTPLQECCSREVRDRSPSPLAYLSVRPPPPPTREHSSVSLVI